MKSFQDIKDMAHGKCEKECNVLDGNEGRHEQPDSAFFSALKSQMGSHVDR